jgi:hypothetical protein
LDDDWDSVILRALDAGMDLKGRWGTDLGRSCSGGRVSGEGSCGFGMGEKGVVSALGEGLKVDYPSQNVSLRVHLRWRPGRWSPVFVDGCPVMYRVRREGVSCGG